MTQILESCNTLIAPDGQLVKLELHDHFVLYNMAAKLSLLLQREYSSLRVSYGMNS